MKGPKLLLKLTVRETPDITGFSYPFLRLLVDEARRLEKTGGLSEKDIDQSRDRGEDWHTPTPAGSEVLSQISHHLRGYWENQDLGTNPSLPKQIHDMLEVAEALLAIFEEEE